MKITAIEPSGNLYGSEMCLLDVIEGTATLGFDWDVVLPGGGGFAELLLDRGIDCTTTLHRDSHKLSRFRKARSYFLTRRHIAARRPSVVYLNQAGMLRAVNVIASGLDVPVVCQIQTLEDARYVASHRSEHASVAAFICNSHFTASFANVEDHKRSIFYQPVMRVGAASGMPPLDAKWRIGILGRIAETKGHWLFLAAARLMLEAGKSQVEFVVIGEGIDNRTTEAFTRAVMDSGMSDHFDFRGFQKDVPFELSRLHVLAIPSLAEPLGRVLLDACVARRPTVVSSAGGLGEFSKHFGVGRQFPSGDAQGLADALEFTCDNYAEEYARFSVSAEDTLKRLSPDSYVSAVASVITRAAAGETSAVEWLGTPQ